MTFAEFELLREPNGNRLELHHGEPVAVPPAKHGKTLVRRSLVQLLEVAAEPIGEVVASFGFQPVPKDEYWRTDVAYTSRKRWEDTPLDGYFQGSPELAVGILLAPDDAETIPEQKQIGLPNGSQEYWVVDARGREVEVSTADGRSITYRSAQEIPLFFAPGVSIRADDIFRNGRGAS